MRNSFPWRTKRVGLSGQKSAKTNGRKQSSRSLKIEHLENRELLSVAPGIQTIGLCNTSLQTPTFYQKDTDTSGYADRQFLYGSSGQSPIIGDWNNDGVGSIGQYDHSSSSFYLRNSNSGGYADYAFMFGAANGGYIPLAGDWNGDGTETIGLYQTSSSTFYLRDYNSGGYANYAFMFGAANGGYIPLAGDWNGDGTDTIGLYHTSTSNFYLRNSNSGGYADYSFMYGSSGNIAIAGDWNGNGTTTIGVYNPTTSYFYLRNSNSTGYANISTFFGSPGLTPVVGNWTGRVQPTLSFQDSDVRDQTQMMFARDGLITRNDAIQILSNVASDDDNVDEDELDDCRMIVTNFTAWAMPEYVEVLADNVVNNTNAANDHYQGSDLDDLVADDEDSANILDDRVNKWFKGLDHPEAAYGYSSYKTATGELFVSGPSINDMDQGGVGDCYLISALGSIADTNASAIQDMFIDNGDNTWTVRFYYYSGGNYVADYVTVDKKLPTNGPNPANNLLIYANDGITYVHPAQRTYDEASNELWIALAEKAYAQWNETGRADRPAGYNGYNAYASLAYGYLGIVYTQVLGQNAAYYAVSGNKQVLINAIAANKAVMIGTIDDLPDGQDGLYEKHAYAITGYNAGNDTFTLYNPWGRFNITGTPTPISAEILWSDLLEDCVGFAVSNTYGAGGFGDPLGLAVNSSVNEPALETNVWSEAVDNLLDSDESFFGEDLDIETRIFTPKAVDSVMRGPVRC